MIAKIGGFLGRNSDGEPGALVIARGLSKFYFALHAFHLFSHLVGQV